MDLLPVPKSSEFPVIVKRSLGHILDDFDACDRDGTLPTPELEAELRAKIDATVFILDKLESDIETLQRGWIELMLKKKARLQARRERRLAYVKREMERRDMTKLKGNVRQIALADSSSAMVFKEAPSAETWSKYPGFVKVVPTYQWDKAAVKEVIETEELPFVEQTRGKHLRYKPKGTAK